MPWTNLRRVLQELRFKVFLHVDGGFVDWTQRLVGNRKERMPISGVGVDPLAMVRRPGDHWSA
ncbi:hypothetical protein [Amycolatopsis sp. TNS106]|uniref:hypothetical protein n=1 Tax=Amycolatopsis sp. TNS106 TaxID=2861750 RepID=UPI001C57B27E|nr:hypothetical protein [Amycolatopsis sp. TNS106]